MFEGFLCVEESLECQIEYSHFTSHNKCVENTGYDYTLVIRSTYISTYIFICIYSFSLDV